MVVELNEEKIIPIYPELLGKYETANKIFDNESLKHHKIIKLEDNIIELKVIELNHFSSKELKDLANSLFSKYNSTSTFVNDNYQISVTKNGINESIEKLYSKHKNLFKEHLIVIANLEKIIPRAKLVNQIYENKARHDILSWNYYFAKVMINNELFYVEFDVRSLIIGENQYRVQRIKKID